MEDDKLEKLTTMNRYKMNPFIGDLRIEPQYRKQYFQGDVQVVARSGDVTFQGFNTMAKRDKVDPKQFIKVYTETVMFWLDLSRTAQKVLSYIMKKMEKNSDKIVISKHDFKELTGLSSPAMMYRGITDLCNAGIIARSLDPIIYFINPAYIFNGDRFALIQVYEKNVTIDEEPMQLTSNNNFEKEIE